MNSDSTDILHGKLKGFCRTCTDFKTWAKEQGLNVLKADTVSQQKECPLDREELGKCTWAFLHTMTAYYPEKPNSTQQEEMTQFINLFSKVYPCDECASDLREQLIQTPPVTTNQHELSQWMCRIHNSINKKLGKPEFDCSKADERWLHGWKDGSCG